MTTIRQSDSESDVHNALTTAISQEQAYVDVLFGRLDDEVARSNQRLSEVMKDVDPSA